MRHDDNYDISLILDWPNLGAEATFRRNTSGFDAIKKQAAETGNGNPLKLNAFLYAFLALAKNFNLFLRVDSRSIQNDLKQIRQKMYALERLEREGKKPADKTLLEKYRTIRLIAAQPNARDEQRTLATLLFSGPSTAKQINEDLGISENLAERVLRALFPIVEEKEEKKEKKPVTFVLRSDTDSLAVTLYLLQYTLGINPMQILQSPTALSKVSHYGAA